MGSSRFVMWEFPTHWPLRSTRTRHRLSPTTTKNESHRPYAWDGDSPWRYARSSYRKKKKKNYQDHSAEIDYRRRKKNGGDFDS